jgi:hypothetical protein
VLCGLQFAFCLLKLIVVASLFLPKTGSLGVLILCILQIVLDLGAGCALGDLIGFHIYLIAKGRTTYAHILIQRKLKEEMYREAEVALPKPEEAKCKEDNEIKVHRQTSSETEAYFSSPNLRKNNFQFSDTGFEVENPTQSAKKQAYVLKELAKNKESEFKDRTDTNPDHLGHDLQELSYDYKQNVFTKRTNCNEVFKETIAESTKSLHKLELAVSSPAFQSSKQITQSRLGKMRPDHLEIESFKDS